MEIATGNEALAALAELGLRGGPAMWAIAALSVLTLAVILWKLWRLAALGAWARDAAEPAVAAFRAGDGAAALALAERSRAAPARLAASAIGALRQKGMDEASAREEAARVGRALLAEARGGLRALELIAAIAPLLGLLGTVLGMIAAFQALQASGAQTDAAALAGGVWEALLTTAAGMAVAIPASVALGWFDSVVEALRLRLEDVAARIFARPRLEGAQLGIAAQ